MGNTRWGVCDGYCNYFIQERTPEDELLKICFGRFVEREKYLIFRL